MGPKRYLWLRRLHQARRALVEEDASETTVARIAIAHGFWEIGRFAVQYRETFGEPPSSTLRRPKRDPSPRRSNPLAL
jgi:AraC family ethanolamine operon transcriptional activator